MVRRGFGRSESGSGCWLAVAGWLAGWPGLLKVWFGLLSIYPMPMQISLDMKLVFPFCRERDRGRDGDENENEDEDDIHDFVSLLVNANSE